MSLFSSGTSRDFAYVCVCVCVRACTEEDKEGTEIVGGRCCNLSDRSLTTRRLIG